MKRSLAPAILAVIFWAILQSGASAANVAPPDNAFVTALAQDAAGRTWVGVEDEGVYRFDPGAPADARWRKFTDKDGLGDNGAYALCEDKLHRIWVGHLNHGVSVYDGQSWKNYDVLDGPIGERVFSIAADPLHGDVWMATSAGLTRYSIDNDRWTDYTRSNGLPADQIQSLAFDSTGTLYAGTQCHGLAIAEPSDDYRQWRRVAGSDSTPSTPEGSGLPSNLINFVLAAHDGTVYVATTCGLARSDDRGRSWTYIRGSDWAAKVKGRIGGAPAGWTERPAKFLLTEDYCTCVAEDEAGRLWIGHRRTGYEVVDLASSKRLFASGKNERPRGGADQKTEATFCSAILCRPGRTTQIGWYGNGMSESPFGHPERQSAPPAKLAAAVEAPTPHPKPRVPPTLAELNSLLEQLGEVPPQGTLEGSVVDLPDDWRTEGDWLGRYGRFWSCLCAMQSPEDYLWGAGASPVQYNARIDPSYDQKESIRYWIHWLSTKGRRTLEMPPTYLHSRVIKGETHHLGHMNRRESEWSDAGYAYPMANEGPDEYCTLTIPDGQFILSVYDHNKDGHERDNRLRDFRVSIRPHDPNAPIDALDDFPTQPELSSGRIRDFWGGVWKRFFVQGPLQTTIHVARNHSFTTMISGVTLDLVDERPIPYFQTADEWTTLRERRAALLEESKSIRAQRSAPQTDPAQAADRLFSEAEAMRAWNPRWWAGQSRPTYMALLRWYHSADRAAVGDSAKPNPRLTTCYYRVGLYESWEQRQRAEKLLPARDIENALRWDEESYSSEGKGYEIVTKYLAERKSATSPPQSGKPRRRTTGEGQIVMQFRDSFGRCVPQADGSAVWTNGRSVFLSTDDPRRWSELPVEAGSLDDHLYLHPVGGDRTRLYLDTSGGNGGGGWLLAYDVAQQQTTIVRRLHYHLAAFASRDVGAISTGQNINWTTDGGATWNATPPLTKRDGIEVAGLWWASPTRLLASFGDGSLMLLERDKANLKQIWSQKPDKPRASVRDLFFDGGYGWTPTPLARLDLETGRFDAPLNIDFNAHTMAVCHGHFLIAGLKSPSSDAAALPGGPPTPPAALGLRQGRPVIASWPVKADKSFAPPTIQTPPQAITAILPLSAPKCLLISRFGAAFVLDTQTNQITAERLEIKMLPPPDTAAAPPAAKAPPTDPIDEIFAAKGNDPNGPTAEQSQQAVELLIQVTPDQLQAIMDRAQKNTGLTRRQRAQQVLDEVRRTVVENKRNPPAAPKNKAESSQLPAAPPNSGTTASGRGASKPGFEPVLQTGHSSNVTAVAYSSNGHFVLTGSQDGTAILWDAATAHATRTFQVGQSGVSAVAISPDGEEIFTGSAEGAAVLWAASTGRQLRNFPTPAVSRGEFGSLPPHSVQT